MNFLTGLTGGLGGILGGASNMMGAGGLGSGVGTGVSNPLNLLFGGMQSAAFQGAAATTFRDVGMSNAFAALKDFQTEQNQRLQDRETFQEAMQAGKSEQRMNEMFRIQQEQMHNAQLRKQQSETAETIGAYFSKGAEKAKELASR